MFRLSVVALIFSTVYCKVTTADGVCVRRFWKTAETTKPKHGRRWDIASGLHRVSQGASRSTVMIWYVQNHHFGMLQAIVALKFAQSAKIDDKKFCSHERKSASSYFPNNTRHLVDFNRKIKLCQQPKVAALIYFASCAANTSTGSIHFVIHYLDFISKGQKIRYLPHTVLVIWLSFRKTWPDLQYFITWTVMHQTNP